MAFNKRKSRTITVKSEIFRYVLSISETDDKDVFMINIVAQHEESNASKLFASGVPSRDYWMDFSWQRDLDQNDYPVIKPKLVSDTILKGIKIGWDYTKNGKNFKMKI